MFCFYLINYVYLAIKTVSLMSIYACDNVYITTLLFIDLEINNNEWL